MSNLPTALAESIAMATICLSLAGCGGSQTSSTVMSAPSSVSASASTVISPAPAAGTLGAACSQIDAVMGADPDGDPAATAKKLRDIRAEVHTPEAGLIEAVAAAYTVIATNPNASADALTDATKALGDACESATSDPGPR